LERKIFPQQVNCTDLKNDCQLAFLLYAALKKGMGYDNIFKGYFGGIFWRYYEIIGSGTKTGPLS